MKVSDVFKTTLDENVACWRCRSAYKIYREAAYISGICSKCQFQDGMIAMLSYDTALPEPKVQHITIYLADYAIKMGWGKLYIGDEHPGKTQYYYGSIAPFADLEIQEITNEQVKMFLTFQ